MVTIPLWAALITGLLTLGASVFASVVLLKNNNKTVAATLTAKLSELNVTEDASLRDDQRELINTLKANTSSWQELLPRYAEAVMAEARTQAQFTSLTAEMEKLKRDMGAEMDKQKREMGAEVEALKKQMQGLQAERNELADKAACVPLLEKLVGEKDEALTRKDVVIDALRAELETQRAMLETAGRAQERVEGAKSQADRVIEQFTATLTGKHEEEPPP